MPDDDTNPFDTSAVPEESPRDETETIAVDEDLRAEIEAIADDMPDLDDVTSIDVPRRLYVGPNDEGEIPDQYREIQHLADADGYVALADVEAVDGVLVEADDV